MDKKRVNTRIVVDKRVRNKVVTHCKRVGQKVYVWVERKLLQAIETDKEKHQ